MRDGASNRPNISIKEILEMDPLFDPISQLKRYERWSLYSTQYLNKRDIGDGASI